MANLNEETTVETNEENSVEETVVEKKQIDPSLQGIQLFYEQNKKMITYVGGGLALIIGAFLFFQLYYLPEQENEAVNEMFWAENLLEKDSFNLALNGGMMVMAADGQKQMKGFVQIAEEYPMTKTGSLANYCAGICYMRTGKFEQAIEHFSKYDGNDETIAPIALGAIGDCHLELNHLDDAVKFYSKAADKNNNNFTVPYFLKKAGMANELRGNYTEALQNYERIQKEYPRSSEGIEIEKDIAKVKAQGNL